MKSFDIKINHFDGRSHHQRQLSLFLSRNPVTPSLSSKKKKTKNEENEVW
jgi:hypothetical protein